MLFWIVFIEFLVAFVMFTKIIIDFIINDRSKYATDRTLMIIKVEIVLHLILLIIVLIVGALTY